jgi:hypothetical protein
MALLVKGGAQFLDLKIGHVADALAQRAFMRTWTVELEPLYQTSLRQQLSRRADHFTQAHPLVIENRNNMGAPGYPYIRLVLGRPDLPAGVNLKQLRMNRSLEETEGQFGNRNINLWRFHISYFPSTNFIRLRHPHYIAIPAIFQVKYQY